MRCKIILFFCSLVGFYTYSQTKNTEVVRTQIAVFQLDGDVISINKLLNKNTSLPPEYALSILDQNIKLTTSTKNYLGLADSYLAKGNFWFTKGNLTKAYEFYTQTENIAKEHGFLRESGIAILNKSNIIEDLDLKIKSLKKAAVLLRKVQDTMNLAKVYLNIGGAYDRFVFENFKNQRDYLTYKTISFENYQLAETLNQTLKNPEIEASLNTHYAHWSVFEKDLPKAKSYFQKAEQFFQTADRIKGVVHCKIELAKIAIENKENSVALSQLNEAELLAKQYDYIDYIPLIYSEYANVFQSEGNYQEALHYQKKMTESKVNFLKTTNKDKIHIVNLERDLLEKKYIEENYLLQKKKNKTLIIVSIVIIVLLTLFFYQIFQNKKRKAENARKSEKILKLEKEALSSRLNNQLLQQELLKEKLVFGQNNLKVFAYQINEINEFLSVLAEKLKHIQHQDTSQPIINSLKLSFAEIMNNQNNLLKISTYETQINQDFFFHIQKKCPSISTEDEQLLTFIIQGKSGKEIGRALNISTESVYTKRYRLRKKLGLNNDESFQDFYDRTIAKI